MKNPLFIVLILQVVMVIVLVFELLMPTMGILFSIAAALAGYSLYLAFADVSRNTGFIILAIDLSLVPILVLFGIKLIAKSPVSLKTTLSSAEGISSQQPDLNALMAKSGIAISLLRPAGIALIDNHRIDVVTKGEFIEKGKSVTVIAVTANQVIVAESK
jgi:membrane-bound serine protease (ClpP class)